MPGIDCERCHGAAAQHVYYHLDNPSVKEAKYLIKENSLTQQQKLDKCAVCHSGNDKLKIESRFKFRPGDTLANFFMENTSRANTTEFDVHGNQYRLMVESECFMKATNMNCSSCHDPHKNTANNLALYSQRCMDCHKENAPNFCTLKDSLGISIRSNCIDCHMPRKPSNAISFTLAGDTSTSSYLLRTHRIAIYAADTKKIHSLKSKRN